MLDLFLTLTSNDSWQGLEQKVNNFEDPLPLHHPVDVSEYFFQLLHILISQINKVLKAPFYHRPRRVQ
jgi:hypothetical protein